MPKDLTKEAIDVGKILEEWEFPEFTKYSRSRTWYISSAIIISLLLIYSFATANILFAIIIIFAVIIFWINQKREPKTLLCRISEEGLIIEDNLYLWDEIKNFWIIYEPPKVKTLYFDFKLWHLPRLPIPLTDQDPTTLREQLLDFLDEDIDREGEPLSDNIGRNLKLH